MSNVDVGLTSYQIVSKLQGFEQKFDLKLLLSMRIVSSCMKSAEQKFWQNLKELLKYKEGNQVENNSNNNNNQDIEQRLKGLYHQIVKVCMFCSLKR